MDIVRSTVDVITEILTVLAIAVSFGTLWFFIFWTGFDFWRRHALLAYSAMATTLIGGLIATTLTRPVILGPRYGLPVWARGMGWVMIGIVTVFGTIADAQIGIRVRSFLPFFERSGHIDLVTTGAYGVVRHPIYAAGIGFQIGVFLVTGYTAVLVACAVFALGALWFTRREEERLIALLDDPDDYVRYRDRVPALVPRLARRN